LVVEAKICGLTRAEDAALAVRLGAARLGVIFAGGPRLLTPAKAREVVVAAGDVPVIGVYQSHDVGSILHMSKSIGLRGAQLHGTYSDQDALQLREAGLEVWRVVLLNSAIPAPEALQGEARHADVFLLEPRHPDRAVGDRATLDLALARQGRQAAMGARVALAGGLTPDSVAEAIRVVGPHLVDVSSGVESAPGIKDPVKLERFLEHVRDAHSPT
jgi:phosphoribosylanthranilate isomerase